MLKKILITTGGLLLITVVLGGIKGLQIGALIAAGANFTLPPEAVTTAQVREETWENTIDVVGSVAAVQGGNVSAESPGKIVKITFESGAVVKTGDLLVKQDTSTEEAQLQQLESTLALAKLNLDRNRDLLTQKTIAQSEFDSSDAQYRQAVAGAGNLRAVIAKKTIRAPFDGRLGIRLVNLGQTLKEGDAIVTLQSLDPIYVNFSLPQQRISQLAVGLPVRVRTDAFPGEITLGKLTTLSPEVDTATRNIKLQATFANGKGQLQPGMFASVAVVLPEKNKVLTLPATSILYAPYGDSIFIVEEKKDEKTGQMGKVVRQQFVRLGARRGDFVAIAAGLKAGDTVVSAGVFKLRNGASVVVDNTLAPSAQLAPKPTDS